MMLMVMMHGEDNADEDDDDTDDDDDDDDDDADDAFVAYLIWTLVLMLGDLHSGTLFFDPRFRGDPVHLLLHLRVTSVFFFLLFLRISPRLFEAPLRCYWGLIRKTVPPFCRIRVSAKMGGLPSSTGQLPSAADGSRIDAAPTAREKSSHLTGCPPGIMGEEGK